MQRANEDQPAAQLGMVPFMLKLVKRGLSNTYRLADTSDGRRISVMKSDYSWASGSIDLDGTELTFTFDTTGGNDLTVTRGIEVLASASHPVEGFRRRYVIKHGDDTLEIESEHGSQQPFVATSDGRPMGSITLKGALGRTAVLDLSADLSIDIVLFAAWLALRDWNKAAQVQIRR